MLTWFTWIEIPMCSCLCSAIYICFMHSCVYLFWFLPHGGFIAFDHFVGTRWCSFLFVFIPLSTFMGVFFVFKVKFQFYNKWTVLCQIFEKNPTKINNYGIWLRYQSRTGYHNMYKEFRDTTLNGAVEQMYTEMASRHRVRYHCIQIIKTATIPAKLCKRESTKQFHNSKIKFPLVFKKVRPPTRKLKTTYKASRPNLFV